MSKSPAGKNKGTQVEGSRTMPLAAARRRPSLSPAPQRGRGLLQRGVDELVVRERVMRETTGHTGSASYPTLTRSNFQLRRAGYGDEGTAAGSTPVGCHRVRR
jgi:hypothetical protein